MFRSVSVLVLALVALSALPGCPALTGEQTKSERREVFQAMLQDNPDLVVEFLKKHDVEVFDVVMGAQKHKAEVTAKKQLMADLAEPYLPDLSGLRPIRGADNAPVTVVEYADFECLPCAEAHRTVKDLEFIYSDTSKVRVVLKHNPIESHRTGLTASLYYEAIAREDETKALLFSDLVFENVKVVADNGEKELKRIVATLGLDPRRIEQRAKSKDIACRVKQDMREAVGFGFTSAPVTLVNGVPVRGSKPLEDYKQVIQLLDENPQAGKGKGRKPTLTGSTPIECLESDLKS